MILFVVFNGTIVLLSVLIGIEIIALIALILVIINGLIYGFECDTIISLLSDIITAKFAFNCMVFDTIHNGIDTALHTDPIVS